MPGPQGCPGGSCSVCVAPGSCSGPPLPRCLLHLGKGWTVPTTKLLEGSDRVSPVLPMLARVLLWSPRFAFLLVFCSFLRSCPPGSLIHSQTLAAGLCSRAQNCTALTALRAQWSSRPRAPACSVHGRTRRMRTPACTPGSPRLWLGCRAGPGGSVLGPEASLQVRARLLPARASPSPRL